MNWQFQPVFQILNSVLRRHGMPENHDILRKEHYSFQHSDALLANSDHFIGVKHIVLEQLYATQF